MRMGNERNDLPSLGTILGEHLHLVEKLSNHSTSYFLAGHRGGSHTFQRAQMSPRIHPRSLEMLGQDQSSRYWSDPLVMYHRGTVG